LELLGKTLVFCNKNVKSILRIGFLAAVTTIAYFGTKACVNAAGTIPLSTQIAVSRNNRPNNTFNEALLAAPIAAEEESSIVNSEDNQDLELLDLLRNSASQQPDSPQWKIVRMRVTAYCTCPKCCGKFSDGITANRHKISRGDTFVAADKRYAFGTQMIIPGYSNERAVEVKDRGRLIKGNRLDVFFNNHRTAKKWGTRYLDVLVKEKP
jgi:3D (Asp-Asp-Asp) domain-containing protein